MSERKLKSKPMTPEEAKATARRVEAALGKHGRGEPLTEHEWTIVQYALGGGCHACGASPAVRVVVSGDSEMASGRGRRRSGSGSPRRSETWAETSTVGGPRGAGVEALFARDGVPEVLGTQYLPLSKDEWEPAIAEEELARLLEDG